MIIGSVAFLLVVMPYFTLVVFATYMYPRFVREANASKGKMLHMYRFLFFQYHAGAYFYSAATLTRGLSICLVPVIVRDNAPVQLTMMCWVILGFFFLQTRTKPWRINFTNDAEGG